VYETFRFINTSLDVAASANIYAGFQVYGIYPVNRNTFNDRFMGVNAMEGPGVA
jgi:hypothetical protein